MELPKRTIVDDLEDYFKNTPREKVLADWAATKEACKGIKSPKVHDFIDIQKHYGEMYRDYSPPKNLQFELEDVKILECMKINSCYKECWEDNNSEYFKSA